jgi:Family of unknown function (DUF5681)
METAETRALQQRVIGRPFPPGVSGNPKGRPLSSRNKLSESFLEALQRHFKAHGDEAIARACELDPVGYLKVIAMLVPKQVDIGVILREFKMAIAANDPARAVEVLQAMRPLLTMSPRIEPGSNNT